MSLSPVALAARRVLAAASHASHEGKARTWKILSFTVALPGVGVCWLNAYMKGKAHSHEQPEFVPYSHLRLRTKVSLSSPAPLYSKNKEMIWGECMCIFSLQKFPWGDGNHTLFHNPHTNPLPDGYEKVDH
uniref:Cytochrome c oxidase polypeptide VIa n=1 Tax=Lates calcarifer TaxID=8187 RepID=A0A4W6CDX5_LATCA